jgi:hypothetical protein
MEIEPVERLFLNSNGEENSFELQCPFPIRRTDRQTEVELICFPSLCVGATDGQQQFVRQTKVLMESSVCLDYVKSIN